MTIISEAEQTLRRNTRFFAMEGAFYVMVTILGANTNNLFLAKMGATDYQMSMVNLIAQFFSMGMLIPLAIVTDRRKNKRTMVVTVLVFISACYLASLLASLQGPGTSAVLPMVVFIGLAIGGTSLCNSTWQAYFSDVTPIDARNHTFSVRNQTMMFVQFSVPVLMATILGMQHTLDRQLTVHRIVYGVICTAAVIDIYLLFRIKGGERSVSGSLTVQLVINAVRKLAGNKAYLATAAAATFFYFAWQLDGTMFFIGLTKYIGLSDFWYVISNVCCGFIQFLTIRYWERLNIKLGVPKVLAIGTIGLVISPLCIMIPLQFHGWIVFPLHFILRLLSDSTLGAVNLNMLQNLLLVIDDKDRALSIAIFSACNAFAMAISPLIGVAIYNHCGADFAGLMITLFVMVICRIGASGIFFIRSKQMDRMRLS